MAVEAEQGGLAGGLGVLEGEVGIGRRRGRALGFGGWRWGRRGSWKVVMVGG